MSASRPERAREGVPAGRALRARRESQPMYAAGSESPPYRAA